MSSVPALPGGGRDVATALIPWPIGRAPGSGRPERWNCDGHASRAGAPPARGTRRRPAAKNVAARNVRAAAPGRLPHSAMRRPHGKRTAGAGRCAARRRHRESSADVATPPRPRGAHARRGVVRRPPCSRPPDGSASARIGQPPPRASRAPPAPSGICAGNRDLTAVEGRPAGGEEVIARLEMASARTEAPSAGPMRLGPRIPESVGALAVSARTIAAPPATMRPPRAPADGAPARSRHGEVRYGSSLRRRFSVARWACLERIAE